MQASRGDLLTQLWSESAQAYEEHVQRYWTHRRITTVLAGSLTIEPSRILDFGCGPGNSTRLLRTFFPDAAIVGLDNASGMIAVARSTSSDAGDVRFVCGDVSGPSAEFGGLFDAIVCSNSLFHVEHKRSTLEAFLPLMEEDGRLVFSLYQSVFQPDHEVFWPCEEELNGEDRLMSDILRALRGSGITVEGRQEDREVFKEPSLRKLFDGVGLRIQCTAILHLERTWQERIAFFAIPSVAQEVFPGVPLEAVQDALDLAARGEPGPPQGRTVYAFSASREK
jgi:SAM-dependent methyltransferase